MSRKTTAPTTKGASSAAEVRGRKERFEPNEVIAALEASAGIISAAARMLRCNRDTVRNYINRYPEIAVALERTEEERLDMAEVGLVGFLGDEKHPALRLKAIEFYLRTKGKKRGYTTATEVVGKDGGPIETKSNVAFDLSGLTEEELAVLEKAALLGIAKAAGAVTKH